MTTKKIIKAGTVSLLALAMGTTMAFAQTTSGTNGMTQSGSGSSYTGTDSTGTSGTMTGITGAGTGSTSANGMTATTPGTPNTGAGGDGSANIAMIFGSAIIALGAMAYIIRRPNVTR